MSATLTSSAPARSRQFASAAQWLESLGNVPLERILFTPPPGTATQTDLLRLVERDKRLCELIDGTLVEKALGYWEAYIAMRIAAALLAYVDEHNLGNVSGPDTTLRMPSTGGIRLPDVAFIAKSRVPRTLDPVPTLAPDLAVEVLSQGNTSAEMDKKLGDFFSSGTKLAWIIDPQLRTTAIHHNAEKPTRVIGLEGTLDGEGVVPGFKLAMADIFKNVPETE